MPLALLVVATLTLAAPPSDPQPESSTETPTPPDPVVVEAEDRATRAELESDFKSQLLEAQRKEAALEVERAKALRAKERAETKAERAEEKRKEAESELAIEKSAKLMELGLTVGTAFAVQAPLDRGSNEMLRQRTASATALPYLMLFPGFWTSNGSVRKYCASQWAGKTEADASGAADALARKKAKLRLDALLDAVYVHPQITLEELRSGAPPTEPSREQPQVTERQSDKPPSRHFKNLTQGQLDKAKELAALIESGDEAKEKVMRKALETELMTSLIGWTPGVPASGCPWRKIGAWIGVPLKYEARVEGQPFEIRLNERTEIDPVVAFGLGYAPNAYVSVLFGATYSRADVQSSMMDPDVRNTAGLWTLTAGLGVNADILTLFGVK